MQDSASSNLSHLLNASMHEAEALLGLLELEREQLENRDIEGLEATLPLKNAGIAELEAKLSQCQSHPHFAATAQQLTAEQTPEQLEPALTSLLRNLKKISNKCIYINDLNGILIVNSRKRNKAALDSLKGKQPRSALYNAAGSTSRQRESESAPNYVSSLS